MLVACNNTVKEDLQILQNDILRICCRYAWSDKVSVARLHKECKIIGIEQRMRKQLLWLMFLLSKNVEYQRKTVRETRTATKINFKVPNKISHQYEHSPYYMGTKLWNDLPENMQKSDNIFTFKKQVNILYKTYKPNGLQS